MRAEGSEIPALRRFARLTSTHGDKKPTTETGIGTLEVRRASYPETLPAGKIALFSVLTVFRPHGIIF
jgi:hypothetical protein